ARTVPRDADAAVVIDELLTGPSPDLGLVGLLPAGTTATRVFEGEALLEIDLTGDPAAFTDPLIKAALRHTLASWDSTLVPRVTVSGTMIDLSGGEQLIYFYSEERDALLAFPMPAADPRDVLAAFLDGPSTSSLVGLPADVELIEFEYSASSGLLSLDFTYRPSVRDFALDHPDAMRRVLEGLIATMTTGFPQIDGLYLDFEGRAALGLGQCADLLRTLQLTPEVLNDERLLARAA
ncbi:MAG TPA: hypothetical protein VFY15_04970, partial [Acidimicrobiia bacterium]|nr:hypothetical protein [Acidimicrobiia bacterium]